MTLEEALAEAREKFDRGDFAGCQALCNGVLRAQPRHPEAIRLFRALAPQGVYGGDFYDAQSDGSYASAQILLGLLFSEYRPRSLVDFGAGVGTWLRAARDLGVETLLGVEGAWVRDRLGPQAPPYRFQDLNAPVRLERRFDLAMSVEVVEHLLPERGASFADDLCRAADLVLFAAAMPHQGGDGHINERLASYWVEQFERNGYACIDFLRSAVWFNPHVAPWYAQNALLFVKKGDPRAARFPSRPLLDVHHPLLVNPDLQARFARGWDDEFDD